MGGGMKNLEQKFRCGDLAKAEQAAKKLGAIDRGILHEHDYFFQAPLGRLKLRMINGHEAAELNAYQRPDAQAPTTSEYFITPIAHPDALLQTLSHSLGKPRELVKTRHLFMYHSTRIHLDKVDGVGGFVELERIMTQTSEKDGEGELKTIVEAMGLSDAVSEAYVDLK